MRSDTQSATIPAEPRQVFAFLADPANLPRWAVGFARGIRPGDNGWVVATGHGDVPIRYEIDERLGAIDFHLEPEPGVDLVAYSRVVPNGDATEYIFTQFQAPGMPDAVFQGQVTALADELNVLRALFHAQAACDTGR